jgi:hypothetical protein
MQIEETEILDLGFSMASAAELTTEVAKLTERVDNHIRFFWGVVATGFVCIGGLAMALYAINGHIGQVAKAQASIPAQTVDALLAKPATSEAEEADKLGAVSVILQSAKIRDVKPDTAVINRVSLKMSDAQQEYPALPQVWRATSAFITYKSQTEPAGAGVAAGAKCNMAIGGNGVSFTNCEVALEDVVNRTSGNTFNGQNAPYVFINCIVHYSGGLLPAARFVFRNSLFHFDVPTVPRREGMRALEQLTTADLSKEVDLQLGEQAQHPA